MVGPSEGKNYTVYLKKSLKAENEGAVTAEEAWK